MFEATIIGFSGTCEVMRAHVHPTVLLVVIPPDVFSTSIFYRLIVDASGKHTHEVNLPSTKQVSELLLEGKPLPVELKESHMEHVHGVLFTKNRSVSQTAKISENNIEEYLAVFFGEKGYAEAPKNSNSTYHK